MVENSTKPPVIVDWIFHCLSLQDEDMFLRGDLEEIYNSIYADKSKLRAYVWYWSQLLFTLPVILRNIIYWRCVMFTNYLKITLRNMKKQKGFSSVNIAGLSIGMACCLLIMIWVMDELSYDRFFKDSKRIYRVAVTSEVANTSRTYARTPGPLAPTLASEIPEVEAYSRIYLMGNVPTFVYDNNEFTETGNVLAVDSTFFQVFSFDLIKGNRASALSMPNSLVITENAALKIFGDDDPLGKTIELTENVHLNVTGVMQNVPRNSHFEFDYLIPISTMGSRLTDWVFFTTYSIIKTTEDANQNEIESKIARISEKYAGDRLRQQGISRKYFLQRFADIYLKSDLEFEMGASGNITYVYIFTVVAFLALLIACINFINLSTARSMKRANEVGVRKVCGAYKVQLIYQFIGESLVISILSMFVAVIIVFLVLPIFNGFTGKQMDISFLIQAKLLLGILLMVIITGVIAGSFPAFILSSFNTR